METGKVFTIDLTEKERTVTLTAKECRRIAYLVKRSMTERVNSANLLFSEYIDEFETETMRDVVLLKKLAVPLGSLRAKYEEESGCD